MGRGRFGRDKGRACSFTAHGDLAALENALMWLRGQGDIALFDLEFYCLWLLASPSFVCLMRSKPEVAFSLDVDWVHPVVGGPKGSSRGKEAFWGQGSTCFRQLNHMRTPPNRDFIIKSSQ